MAFLLYIGVKIFLFLGIPAAIIFFIVVGLAGLASSTKSNDDTVAEPSSTASLDGPEPYTVDDENRTLTQPLQYNNKYYAVLEVDMNASPDDIKGAYRTLCKVWHPDRFSHDAELEAKAVTKMQEINEAYRVLCQQMT